MIITITGTEGAGKSTLSKALSEKLGLAYVYVGGIRRQLAQERGLTLAEFNKIGEEDPSTDVDVDKRVVQEVKKLGKAVVEGRTMYHFFPNSIKIFLTVEPKVAAERILNDPQAQRKNEALKFKTIDDVLRNIQERHKTDDFRYRKYYNIDAYDPKNFDFVLDTTNLTMAETLEKVLKFIESLG
jgi:cytidylate kinase